MVHWKLDKSKGLTINRINLKIAVCIGGKISAMELQSKNQVRVLYTLIEQSPCVQKTWQIDEKTFGLVISTFNTYSLNHCVFITYLRCLLYLIFALKCTFRLNVDKFIIISMPPKFFKKFKKCGQRNMQYCRTSIIWTTICQFLHKHFQIFVYIGSIHTGMIYFSYSSNTWSNNTLKKQSVVLFS